MNNIQFLNIVFQIFIFDKLNLRKIIQINVKLFLVYSTFFSFHSNVNLHSNIINILLFSQSDSIYSNLSLLRRRHLTVFQQNHLYYYRLKLINTFPSIFFCPGAVQHTYTKVRILAKEKDEQFRYIYIKQCHEKNVITRVYLVRFKERM